MQAFLKRVARLLNQINEAVGKSVSWLTTALVLIICIDVFLRYLFGKTSVWIGELQWHLFALIFLLGAGYAFKHDRHVRVDVFYAKFSERDKALVNFWGTLLFLIPWCILIIIFSFEYALEAFRVREGSPDPGGLPARYVIKFSITLGVGLLLLQGIALLIESWLTLQETPTTPHN